MKRGAGTVLVGALAAAGALAGCTTAPGAQVHTPYGPSTPAHLEGGPADEVKVGTVAGLGSVLVDGEGLTLYMFTTDHRGQRSRCVDLCAVAWPPALLAKGTAAPIAGPGIHAGLLGTSVRADGTTQLTYDGWPLYTWPQDTSPGEATGQALTNLGGRWYVLAASGDEITTP